MNWILKNKFGKILLLIAATAFGIYSVIGIGKVGHQVEARNIEEDVGKAVEQLNNSQVGTQRLEVFIQKLKAVNTSTAPIDLKQALDDYIDSLQNALDAYKSGQSVTNYDQQIAEKKEVFSKILKKYLDSY